MWFRLAALWGCPVTEAQARCGGREFAEWNAYWNLEPWGSIRDDVRAVWVGLAARSAMSKQGPEVREFFRHLFRLEDQSPEDMLAIAQAMAGV